MFNFLQNLFTARALERALKEKELEAQNLKLQLNECEKERETLNETLRKKIPSAGVTVDPPKRKTLMGRNAP